MSWLSDVLEEQYTLVREIKRTPDKTITVLENRENGKRLLRRELSGINSVYPYLLKLNHINLVTILEVEQSSEQTTVLEEYIEGHTIAETLETGLYEESGVRVVVSSLCDGLAALHEKHIIHRDIKPENVILNREGIVKLLDFDAAKIYKPYQEKDTELIGTTGFAAPEQFGITQSDNRTDIFALGVMMNVMLTGYHPSRKLYSGRLGRIIETCIQINPDKRYPSVKHLKRYL